MIYGHNFHKPRVFNMSILRVQNGAPKIICMAVFWTFWGLLKFECPQLLQSRTNRNVARTWYYKL